MNIIFRFKSPQNMKVDRKLIRNNKETFDIKHLEEFKEGLREIIIEDVELVFNNYFSDYIELK